MRGDRADPTANDSLHRTLPGGLRVRGKGRHRLVAPRTRKPRPFHVPRPAHRFSPVITCVRCHLFIISWQMWCFPEFCEPLPLIQGAATMGTSGLCQVRQMSGGLASTGAALWDEALTLGSEAELESERGSWCVKSPRLDPAQSFA